MVAWQALKCFSIENPPWYSAFGGNYVWCKSWNLMSCWWNLTKILQTLTCICRWWSIPGRKSQSAHHDQPYVLPGGCNFNLSYLVYKGGMNADWYAGYYSYKFAEVLSADAFAAFEEAGLEDEQSVAKTGRRFRDTVLALGGGRAPDLVFKVISAYWRRIREQWWTKFILASRRHSENFDWISIILELKQIACPRGAAGSTEPLRSSQTSRYTSFEDKSVWKASDRDHCCHIHWRVKSCIMHWHAMCQILEEGLIECHAMYLSYSLLKTCFKKRLGCDFWLTSETALQDFRGRDPSSEALLRHNDLLPVTA